MVNPEMWTVTETGNAHVSSETDPIVLRVLPTASGYSNAQISSYDPAKRDFREQAPLHLSLRARASDPAALRGTAGFGLWNHPFAPGERGLRLPQALWFFFASSDSEMALAQGVAGSGWKAATFNAQRAPFYALLPAALPGFLLMRVPALYRRLWRIGQNAIGVREQALPLELLADWHQYTLIRERERVVFLVDDAVVLESSYALPQQPLGLIAWIDNQYAIITPQGRIGWGVIPIAAEQTLLIRDLELKNPSL
jgi:hypothetical protein